MYLHQRAIAAIGVLANLMLGKRPAEQPFGFLGAHVDTAVAHGRAEVLVPVGAVEGMSLGGEETGPGDAGQLVIIRIGKQVAIAHVLGRILFHDAEFTLRRFGGKAAVFRTAWEPGGDGCLEHFRAILIGHAASALSG